MESYLVIGGCGFLGRHIVEQLLERGEKQVSVFDLVQRHFDDNVTFFTGDITAADDLRNAVDRSQATIIIHTASPIHGLGKEIYHKVNVTGTSVVISVAQSSSTVKKLVYTSSAGVVYNGLENLVDVDERLDIPEGKLDDYNQTKWEAEKLVLAANDKNGLLTCALRPAGIFGPGDRQLIPGLLTVIKNGQTKYQIGKNENLFDWTYVGNVAHAHLLAADRLGSSVPVDELTYPLSDIDLYADHPSYRVPTSSARPIGPQPAPNEEEKAAAKEFAKGLSVDEQSADIKPVLRTKMDQFGSNAINPPKDDEDNEKPAVTSLEVAGQAYFITNCEPVYFWDFTRALWKGFGHIAPKKSIWVIPSDLGLMLGWAAERWSRLMGKEPGFTEYRVKFATQARYYNVEKARRLLGYSPVIGVEEAIQKTIAAYNAEQAAKAVAEK